MTITDNTYSQRILELDETVSEMLKVPIVQNCKNIFFIICKIQNRLEDLSKKIFNIYDTVFNDRNQLDGGENINLIKINTFSTNFIIRTPVRNLINYEISYPEGRYVIFKNIKVINVGEYINRIHVEDLFTRVKTLQSEFEVRQENYDAFWTENNRFDIFKKEVNDVISSIKHISKACEDVTYAILEYIELGETITNKLSIVSKVLDYYRDLAGEQESVIAPLINNASIVEGYSPTFAKLLQIINDKTKRNLYDVTNDELYTELRQCIISDGYYISKSDDIVRSLKQQFNFFGG